MMRLLFFVLAMMFSAVPATAQNNVKVTVKLEEPEAIVGQPVTLRVTILVPTWMTKGADFPNIEVPGVMVRLPERSGGPVSETIDGETWSGVQRGYRIYPLEAGTFDIPDQSLTITYADPGSSEPVQEKVEFDGVSLKGVLPEKAKQLDPPIIAKSFSLEQTIEGETKLKTGDAITRILTAKIDGTTPVLIPALTSVSDDESLRAYTNEPIVTESENRGVLSGSRTEKTTYVAQSAGSTTIPAVSFSWYNIDTNEIETVSIPEIEITTEQGAAAGPEELDPQTLAKWFIWLAAGLILAAILYRFAYPPIRRWKQSRHLAWLGSEEYAHKQILQAIKSKNLNAVSVELENWLGFFPDPGGSLAKELETELAKLGVFEFGQRDPGNTEPANWKAFRDEYQRLRKQKKREQSLALEQRSLPDLNPAWNS